MNNAIGTTNIDALPLSNPGGIGNNNNNISFDTFERGAPPQQQPAHQYQPMMPQQQQQQQPQQPQYQPSIDNITNPNANIVNNNMSQQNMNQFVNGLQQASMAGMTALPSRDIPQNQEHLTRDNQMRPNYIPAASPEMNDYISNQTTNQSINQTQFVQEARAKKGDYLYDELQTPIILAVLYFMFQLPVVRKQLFTYLPVLFHADGHPNLSGYVFNSLLFAGIYAAMTKLMAYFAI